MRAIFFKSCLILKRRVSAVSKDEVRRPPDGLLLNEQKPSGLRAAGGRPLAPHGRRRQVPARAWRPDDPGAHRRSRGPAGGRPGRSEEHTSELQSLMRISYAVFCLKKKTQ